MGKVNKHLHEGQYRARVGYRGRRYFIGWFDTREEAFHAEQRFRQRMGFPNREVARSEAAARGIKFSVAAGLNLNAKRRPPDMVKELLNEER